MCVENSMENMHTDVKAKENQSEKISNLKFDSKRGTWDCFLSRTKTN